ncbi:MAG: class I SAM-dependent methyltransferase [Caulobacteraceae bacterium]
MERSVYQRIRELETVHWWFTARRRIIGRVIQALRLPSPARVLEVGCGTGGNLELLRQFGPMRAMELDEASRAYAAERSGLAVDGGALPHDLPYAPASFDLVCAFDVIEHVAEDQGAVSALAGLLAPGGVLLTTVPAYGWMWSRHDELHHHKRRYHLKAYRHLFEAAGLKVERASYFNTLLFPLAVTQRLVKKVLRRSGPDDAMPSPGLNRVLAGVFGAERYWLSGSGFPFGLSILLAARKAG